MNRITWIDTAKGILIMLVIIGHCHINSVVDYIISSFHMGAFFLISGITFNTKNAAGGGTFVVKRLKTLLLPYAVFSFIMLLYLYLSHFISGNSFSISSGLLSILVPISGRTVTNVYGLWFLPCLFLADMVMLLIIKLWHKNKVLSIISGISIGAGCFLTDWISQCVSIISIVPFAVLCMLIGYAAKDYLKKCQKISAMAVSLVAFFIFTSANYILTKSPLDLSSMNLGASPLYLLSSLSGAVFVCSISGILTKLKIFTALGKDTLYYYGLHYEILGLVTKVVKFRILQPAIIFALLIPLVYIYKKVWNTIFNKKKKSIIV